MLHRLSAILPTVTATTAGVFLMTSFLGAQQPVAPTGSVVEAKSGNGGEVATKSADNLKAFREFRNGLLKLAAKLQRSDRPEEQERAKVILAALEKAERENVENQFQALLGGLSGGGAANPGAISKLIGQDAQLTKSLNDILAILMTDDDSARRKAEIKSLEDAIKAATKIKNNEESIRARTEISKLDPNRLAKEEAQNAKDLKELLDKLAGKDPKAGGDKPSSGGKGETAKSEPKTEAKSGDNAGEKKNDTGADKADSKDPAAGGDPKAGPEGASQEKPGGDKGKESGSEKPGAGEGSPMPGGEEKAGGEGKSGGEGKESPEGKPGGDGEGKPGGDGEGKPGSEGKPGDGSEKPGGEGKPGNESAGKPGGEEGKPGESAGKPGAEPGKPGGEPGAGKPSDKPSAGGKPGEGAGKPGGKPGDAGKPGDGAGKPGGKPSEGKSAGAGKGQGKGGEGKGGKGGEGKGKGGEGKPGSGGGEGKPGGSKGGGESGSGGGGSPPPGGPQAKDQPGRRQLEEAYPNQKEAEDELKKNNRPNAGKGQDKAIEKIGQSIAEMEKRLKQLREEELLKLLANIEARCNRMLAMQVEVYNATKDIHATVTKNNGQKSPAEHQKSQQEADKEGNIVAEADKAMKLLESEGSAVAFARVLEEVRQDMIAVQRRLADGRVDTDTQEIEENIIAILKDMVAALKKAQQDPQQSEGEGKPGQPGKPGNKKLIDLLAELKLIKTLQEQVNNRTKLEGRKAGDYTNDPILQKELKQLAERQAKLQDMINKIANGGD